MRYALINLLACPMCGCFPLKLYVIDEVSRDKEYAVNTPFCDVYCARNQAYIDSVETEKLDCKECVKHDVITGVIVCPKCGRWYPIIDGVPLMYPDDKRSHSEVRKIIVEFIEKQQDRIPEELKEIVKADKTL